MGAHLTIKWAKTAYALTWHTKRQARTKRNILMVRNSCLDYHRRELVLLRLATYSFLYSIGLQLVRKGAAQYKVTSSEISTNTIGL